jgi:hypothetical protein
MPLMMSLLTFTHLCPSAVDPNRLAAHHSAAHVHNELPLIVVPEPGTGEPS